MFKKSLALVALSVLTLSANAALYDRGDGLIYDDVLDITWLQDANYAKTSGYDADGLMNWADANAWADGLSYGGYDDWRLASANLIGTGSTISYDGSTDLGYNNTTGELGHMFYTNLGNLGVLDTSGAEQSGWGLTNTSFTDADSGDTASFSNVQSFVFWYGEEYAPNTDQAWVFYTQYGQQSKNPKNVGFYSWAVRDGDVSQVPVPGAAWLFGSALIGLAGMCRKRKQAA